MGSWKIGLQTFAIIVASLKSSVCKMGLFLHSPLDPESKLDIKSVPGV